MAAVQTSLQDAFEMAEMHKDVYLQFQDMVMEDASLDIEGLSEAFKAKTLALPAASSTETKPAGECERDCFLKSN